MRKSTIERKTNETEMSIMLNIDGDKNISISSPIKFFNHMLNSLAFYGSLDINLNIKGDIQTGAHHTVEDTGFVFGKALKKALKEKKGIKRSAFNYLCMDEVLVRTVIDLSGRSELDFNCRFNSLRCGDFKNCLTEEFFRGFIRGGSLNLHIDLIKNGNDHHKIEAIFKSVGLSIKEAVKIEGDKIPSTKGVIDYDRNS